MKTMHDTKENTMDENKIAIEAAVDALREQTAQIKALSEAYADMSYATAELLRSRAAAIRPRTTRKAPPPPVSTHLRRFADALADKTSATSALLTDDQRRRIGTLVPAFTCAALGNEPDVVAMVVRWLDLSPEDIAHDLTTNLDAFERRFAS
jgi:hypothetical protein